jgi:hypothetical protein
LLSIFFQIEAGTEEVPVLTFLQLEEMERNSLPIPFSKVHIRGFLYSLPESEGQFILAEEPNIKSCCIHKFKRKIRILGEIAQKEINLHVQLIEGTLQRDLSKNDKTLPLLLFNARLIKEEKGNKLLLGATICVISLLFFLKKWHG